MTDIVHTDALDLVLYALAASGLKVCLTQTEPFSLSDCTSLSGSGGKRLTNEPVIPDGSVTVVNGLNANSRKAIIPPQSFDNGVQVAVDVSIANYWMAIYDGSKILFKSDSITPRTIAINETVMTPAIEFELRQ